MSRAALRLLVFVLFCLSSTTAGAQRIYVLSVGDTSEKGGLSFSTGPDLQYMFDAFYVNVPGGQLVTYNNPLADFADGSSRNVATPWEGPDVRGDLVDMKAKILQAIDNCPAGRNDTIFVFYTGHGASDDQGQFLVMPDGKNRLYRKTILVRIARKGPRLAVLITDSCSLQVPAGLAPGAAAKLIPPQRISPLFDSLFIRSRGVVDINSSSEGEVAIGAIGGGLLTLSLAYMGNQPDFKSYPGFTRPQRGSFDKPGNAAIPSVDHSMAMEEFFGRLSEHGMHGNFDPNKPPFGIFFEYRRQNLNWEAVARLLKTKVHVLFTTVAPQGWDTRGRGKQMTQTPRVYSLPKTQGGSSRVAPPGQRGRRWSRPTYRPEVGDRILQVNGRAIRNLNDYYHAVKGSPTTMTFVLWEARTGKKFLLRAQLNPRNANSRFGVGCQDAPGGGVRVTNVMRGYPGSRCQLAE